MKEKNKCFQLIIEFMFNNNKNYSFNLFIIIKLIYFYNINDKEIYEYILKKLLINNL